MTNTVLFQSLKGVLERLGFQTQAVPGSRAAFEHAGSGALVVLRFYQDDEKVRPPDLAIARRVLDELNGPPSGCATRNMSGE
jgi:hypothetical protein